MRYLYSQVSSQAYFFPIADLFVQENWGNFLSLTKISALPSFTSDLAVKHFGTPENAEIIPILDDSAETTYYCSLQKRNKSTLRPFWERYQ